MPDITRLPLRMECSGIDLVHPLDRMPQGAFPYLLNARVLVEGRIDCRAGYDEILQLTDPPNSIRRLNDPSTSYAPTGYIYVGGGGGNLYAGPIGSYVPVDSGYSGDPLSLVPFKPDQSPESWMYVYDRYKLAKVRADGVVRSVGVVPPRVAPLVEYGVPADVDIDKGQDSSVWSTWGIDTTLTTFDRTNFANASIGSILYDIDDVGWCCISPNMLNQPFWVGERMKVILNAGGGNEERVMVRQVLPAITATTLAAIAVDGGSPFGPCSIVLQASPVGLERNSLLVIDTEIVRVLEVNKSPNTIDYSIRCQTKVPHAPGAAVTGMVSWYAYTGLLHGTGETITSNAVGASHAAAGIGGILSYQAINAATAAGRPMDPANDYLHISFFLQNPEAITTIKLLLSLDSSANFSYTNPGNSLIWTIPQAALNTQGSSGNSWVDVVLPISQAVRTGSDQTRTLDDITGLAIQLDTTGGCGWGFDWWYLFGTYGPTIPVNSPTGYVYQVRFRDSSTGAKSVPGPQTRYQVFPLRESVIITSPNTGASGVDSVDIYRDGGTITSPLYVGSSPLAMSFTDTLPDLTVLGINQPSDLTALQPWPLQQLPWKGTVDVVGTSVIWNSGDQWNRFLLSNTIITIDGVSYLTYGNPFTGTFLELTQDAGNKINVPFEISLPVLAGRPLPFAFGPEEGPYAPVVFALGDSLNGGTLYFSNFSDADSASDANTLEISHPGSDLVSGAIWNGLCFAGTRDDVLCVRFSYLSTIGVSNSNSFQWAKVPVPSGIWSRWACCRCSLGVAYLGRDGIYICNESGGKNISDAALYPMFPHDGVPAAPVTRAGITVYPVDMTQVTKLRLSYCDQTLRFDYIDTNHGYNTLVFDLVKQRWFLHVYADHLSGQYLVEASAANPLDQEILALSIDRQTIVKMGNVGFVNTDRGQDIHCKVLTPSNDSGDERAQKLYVDAMVQADGLGTLTVAPAMNNAETLLPSQDFSCIDSIQQFLLNIAKLADLSLYRNIGALFSWTGGPLGPRLYAYDVTAFPQPMLTSRFVTQINTMSFPGWKHMRRLFPALISLGDVLMYVKCQDGRLYGPYTIPSTNGAYRILPQILDHGVKDLAFALELDGAGTAFAFYPQEFTAEMKEWNEESYIKLALFRA